MGYRKYPIIKEFRNMKIQIPHPVSIWNLDVFDKNGFLKTSLRDCHNVVTDEGANAFLNCMFHGSTQLNPWYILLFEDDYTPIVTDTYAVPGFTECTAYSETVRQTFVESAASSRSLDNISNKATVNINGTKSLYGAGLVSGGAGDNLKGNTDSEILIEDCEDAWDESVDADVTSTADADCQVGSSSAKLVVAAACAAGDILATEVVAVDLTKADKIRMWLKCSVATNAGDLQLLLDDTALCASPLETLDVPAVSANTWTQVTMTLSDPTLLSTIISIGLKYTVDIGACDIFIDDVKGILSTSDGVLYAAAKFTAAVPVENLDVVKIWATLTT